MCDCQDLDFKHYISLTVSCNIVAHLFSFLSVLCKLLLLFCLSSFLLVHLVSVSGLSTLDCPLVFSHGCEAKCILNQII